MNGLDGSFWAGKKVFLTGHTGFKGSWLSLWLLSMGAELTGYALEPNTEPNLFRLADVGRSMRSILGDVRDLERLRASLVEAQPEIVIHMAAQPIVRESYRAPVQTYATNVMGTVNLLEAVRNCGSVRAVVNITTDKCYENREWLWSYRENETLGGYDPYSSSKACSELITAAYRHSFFNPAEYGKHGVAVATARAGNVLGGGDWAQDRLIPDILRAIAAGEKVRLRSPHAIRPWQLVLEPLCGYLLLAQKLIEEGPAVAEAWNFGPNDDDAREVRWIAERMCSLWGKDAGYVIDGGEALHEANYLKLDSSKARARLGWRPVWGLGRALEELTAWHRAYLAGNDLKAECLASIGRYTKDMDSQ
jgi:CDP-glucose 4,6-dehydratase